MSLIANNPSLRNQLEKAGLISIRSCTEEEKKQILELRKAGEELPNGVFEYYSGGYSKYTPSDFSDAEALAFLSLAEVRKIRQWVTFFGVLALIGLICGLISVIAALAH